MYFARVGKCVLFFQLSQLEETDVSMLYLSSLFCFAFSEIDYFLLLRFFRHFQGKCSHVHPTFCPLI